MIIRQEIKKPQLVVLRFQSLDCLKMILLRVQYLILNLIQNCHLLKRSVLSHYILLYAPRYG